MESVREWEMQFKEKYDYVGRLLKPGEEPSEYTDEEDTKDHNNLICICYLSVQISSKKQQGIPTSCAGSVLAMREGGDLGRSGGRCPSV
eukprot:bmy_09269T0